MADEPRRSGRATKGQHKHASSSPPPQPAAPKLPTKAVSKAGPKTNAKSKPGKRSQDPDPADDDDDDGEEEEIRCICANTNPKDKRAFIGCDACTVWQHNVCMGVTDDEDDVPDHYFCEECRPEEHQETLQALANDEKIWETRNKIYQSERRSSKGRKGKSNVAHGWLRKSVPPEPTEAAQEQSTGADETSEPGTKRKREEVKEESVEDADEEKPTRPSRQDKRRKSSAPAEAAAQPERKPDPTTAVVDLDKLPADRQKIATALSKIIAEVVTDQAKTGFSIPAGDTAKSLADRHATLIEYELQMTYGGPSQQAYMSQFRALNANMKKNKVLAERIIRGSLSAHDLATMESKDMASEELQKERAAMKEVLDRQAVAIQEEGPRYRSTHKGVELIEDENQNIAASTAAPPPVRERYSIAEGEEGEAGSPPAANENQGGSPLQKDGSPPQLDTTRASVDHTRRQSSQNFDMSNIWAKTAGSPTTASGPRPQVPAPRRSSTNAPAAPDATLGTQHDADIDRMLQDDDEPYNPADQAGQDVVWRGKLLQSSDGANPIVNARWVAGRDLTPTVPWRSLMPAQLSIDGRLAIDKAESYLCSLQWSNSSDVSVLALTPFDDADEFGAIFHYFKSRERYAVINKDKPAMVRDMYIIPVDVGEPLPEHVGMLEHCTLKSPAEEQLLLASLVIARAPGTPPVPIDGAAAASPGTPLQTAAPPTNGHQPHLPHHVRSAGPAGSPVTSQPGMFSPNHHNNHAAPAVSESTGSAAAPAFTPNPYAASAPPAPPGNPLVAEVLGTLQFAPTAQQILAADPNIDREKLENLRRIMEADPRTRTDINALGRKLMG